MANKKINQLDIRLGGSLNDLVLIGDPTTGISYKLTAAEFCTLIGVEDLKDFPVQFGNNGKYLATDGINLIWQTITQPTWGNITGILSNQTDLQNALNGKFDDPTGNSSQYIDGTGALQTFPSLLSSDKLLTQVYNKTGATLTKGTIVYISGSQGNLPAVSKAIATSDATSAQTYGAVQYDISNMSSGYVVAVGAINDLDTQAYPDGTQLYLSGTTAGGYTSTKPYAPIHLVYVGVVVRSHPTQGIIQIKIQNGYELDELHNVDAYLPSNGDGIFYNSTTGLWEHKQMTALSNNTNTAATLFNFYNFI